MTENEFFERKGPFPLSEIIKIIGCNNNLSTKTNFKIRSLESLDNASNNDMTFLNSGKYQDLSLKTKAVACITTSNLSKFLPKECIRLDVKNVLFAVTKVTKMFFPKADLDFPDENLTYSNNIENLYPEVKFGQNVLVGKNVKIGKNSYIGSNSIIESNVNLGKNCVIGSFVSIRNSIISDNVYIQDGVKIGVKGFGFIPDKNKNTRTPHIGKVILEEGVEIGANSTIDRGSISNTIIGKNTFIDNQVHVAHNVQMGKNCMIAGQVGFAGSTTLGDNVVIGGQAGVSGHLVIGNNVKIGGGSGVINNIPDNSQVMGYPAIPIKDFIKQRKNK
ncbi:MAG: UDP-3-O-(3-hydroxymyristoyl)glucosamine N-acyltransferase [Candidatus Pelagibacterales bacterium]|nr:MAG: UDP-3-O-(3-hydroxymyristoyl)glucosamine N-acyltransferase [Pelagibacterales bacterium]